MKTHKRKKDSQTTKSAARSSVQRKVIQRKPCNINDRDTALEAMHELRRQAQVRLVMGDDGYETWAMLMGAKALDRLAG